jgi:hypothetical protein
MVFIFRTTLISISYIVKGNIQMMSVLISANTSLNDMVIYRTETVPPGAHIMLTQLGGWTACRSNQPQACKDNSHKHGKEATSGSGGCGAHVVVGNPQAFPCPITNFLT